MGNNRVFRFAASAVAASLFTAAAQAGTVKYVVLLSVDGLHASDVSDPALADAIPNIRALAEAGVTYSSATGTTPSDSFPGTLAYLTGAGPATTGVYYDDTFCRSLCAPGQTTAMGTEVLNTEAIDKDSNLLDGGGDFGFNSLDPAKLPTDSTHGSVPVYPHAYLKVNTILEIAHQAGLRTSIIDKHPAYEIAAGPSGHGIDDLYCPEIDAKAALIDGKLVDAKSAPPGTKLKRITKSAELAIAYDDMKAAALVRELHGMDSRGIGPAPVPAIVAMNLQALNVAGKTQGGIDLVDGKEVPTPALIAALKHSDDTVHILSKELQAAGLWDQTLLVLTAKHGQNPRVGTARAGGVTALNNALTAAGVEVASATLDDVALIWLKDSTQTDKAADAIKALQSTPQNPGIDKILYGDALSQTKLAGPADRTPDLILVLQPGVVFMDKPTKHAEHGGFCEDDTHVPLILSGGAVGEAAGGKKVQTPVKTTQIAVTVLESLGLNPADLQGAQTEKTTALPDSGLTVTLPGQSAKAK